MERVHFDRYEYEKAKQKYLESRRNLKKHEGIVLEESDGPNKLDFLVFSQKKDISCCVVS